MASALGLQRSDLYRYLSFFKLPRFIQDDLNSDPGLLGRDAAEAIVMVIKQFGGPAEEAVSRIWTRLKKGDVEQGKVAGIVEASLYKGAPAAQKEIQKLFSGSNEVGSIVSDGKRVKVSIAVKALTPEKEEELRRFIERLVG